MKKHVWGMGKIAAAAAVVLLCNAQIAAPANAPKQEKKQALPRAVELRADELDKFTSQKFYRYEKEASLLERLLKKLRGDGRRKLPRGFGTGVEYALVGIGVAAILFTLYVMVKRGAWRRVRNKDVAMLSDIDAIADDEDVLERRLRAALAAQRFAEAARWLFLITLKRMHEQGIISLDARKTVNEYAYEIDEPRLQQAFREASLRFACYRYGHVEVNDDAYRQFATLNDSVLQLLNAARAQLAT